MTADTRNTEFVRKALNSALLVETSEDAKMKERDVVSGYDFNQGIDYQRLVDAFATTGFQATHFSRAVRQIKLMLKHRDDEFAADDSETDEFIRRKNGCSIFLGFTSNMVSCGVRESIRFLVQHRLVDCIVTTAGGIEEDLIKCLAETRVGDFGLQGQELRGLGVNRIGNLLVPNDNYSLFHEWVMPVFDEMAVDQESGTKWTPSTLIQRLGEKIGNEESICYWAARNHIPVFCPALTDGSMGEVLMLHSLDRAPGSRLVVDVVPDVQRITSISLKAQKSGIVILGGGVVKHHIANANLMRNGADFAVYLNSLSDFDGSDSGATADEAKSWGKIRPEAQAVKVVADATLTFPLLVSQTFAPHVLGRKTRTSNGH